MKKIISINISGVSFFIDEDAFEKLNNYLDKLKKRFNVQESGHEIIADIETRLSELFAERINPKTGVITIEMVDEVTQIMGQPEDFTDEDDESNDQKKTESNYDNAFRATTQRRLYRDIDTKILGGVCGGIAAYFSIDPIIVRIIFVIAPFLSLGVAIPVYIVLWIAIPAAITMSQKLEMRGENITVSNIEKKIKEEYEDVKSRFDNFRKTNKTYRQSEDYVKTMDNRDRTALIVTGIVVLLLIVGKITVFPLQNYYFMGFLHFPFPGFFALAIILLVLGLVFRSAFKGFVIIIIAMAVIAIFIRMITWIIGSTFFPFSLF